MTSEKWTTHVGLFSVRNKIHCVAGFTEVTRRVSRSVSITHIKFRNYFVFYFLFIHAWVFHTYRKFSMAIIWTWYFRYRALFRNRWAKYTDKNLLHRVETSSNYFFLSKIVFPHERLILLHCGRILNNGRQLRCYSNKSMLVYSAVGFELTL